MEKNTGHQDTSTGLGAPAPVSEGPGRVPRGMSSPIGTDGGSETQGSAYPEVELLLKHEANDARENFDDMASLKYAEQCEAVLKLLFDVPPPVTSSEGAPPDDGSACVHESGGVMQMAHNMGLGIRAVDELLTELLTDLARDAGAGDADAIGTLERFGLGLVATPKQSEAPTPEQRRMIANFLRDDAREVDAEDSYLGPDEHTEWAQKWAAACDAVAEFLDATPRSNEAPSPIITSEEPNPGNNYMGEAESAELLHAAPNPVGFPNNYQKTGGARVLVSAETALSLDAVADGTAVAIPNSCWLQVRRVLGRIAEEGLCPSVHDEVKALSNEANAYAGGAA